MKAIPDDVLARLGQVPDVVLATEAGVSVSMIRKRRVERGLRAARVHRRGIDLRQRVLSALAEWDEHPLHLNSIAAHAGIPKSNLQHLIKRMLLEKSIVRHEPGVGNANRVPTYSRARRPVELEVGDGTITHVADPTIGTCLRCRARTGDEASVLCDVTAGDACQGERLGFFP